MATQTPTTAEISANILAQLEATLNQTIPLLPRAFNRVLAKALGAVFVVAYKYIGFVFLQMFVQTASIRETTINGRTISPLTAWGRLLGVGDPTGATRAELTASVPVETAGGTIPSGSLLFNQGNGYTYRVVSAVLLEGSSVTINLRAVNDPNDSGGRGAAGNLSNGAQLRFSQPTPGAGTVATVTGQTVTAADAEDAEVYRRRVIETWRARPQGGAYADYRQWAESEEGIVRAYPYTGLPGTVVTYVEATTASSGSPDGIPTQAQLDAVLNAINQDSNGLATRRPANAAPIVRAITRTEFTVRVLGISGVGNLAAVQEQVTAAVQQFFLNREPYIAGLDFPPRLDRVTATAVTSVAEDVVTAAGGVFTDVVLQIGPATLQVYTLGEGEKAKATVAFV